MTRTIKYIVAAFLAMPLFSSCLEETSPTSGMTLDQVEESDNSLDGLNNAICRKMLLMGNDYSSCGYAGIMLHLDVASGNLPVTNSYFDYLLWFANDSYLGATGLTTDDWWELYTELIQAANLTLNKAPETSEASTDQLAQIGNALAYRAKAYLDMVRLYEYMPTGHSELDDKATQDNVYKLTVPLITENTTEEEARNNPRRPFYVMYRFIMNDLNRAELYLQGVSRSSYNKADAAVAFGLKARLWLEMGSRFTKYPEDLQTQISHEDDSELSEYDKLGITTATECFAKAAQYARLAISEGYTPVTQEEWYDTERGFNTATDAWMWAIQIKSDDISSSTWSWKSYISFLSPETGFGVAGYSYENHSARMIDAALYSTIENGDWRKNTWIAPEDAGKADNKYKYETQLSDSRWVKNPAYTGFKFRPGDGNMSDYRTGIAVDIPLMRVEEMYLIEAEAKAHTDGVAAGAKALETFLNNYRFTDRSYKCTATAIEDFNEEIVRQRRIEFWGEGIVFFDYKRMAKNVVTEYDDSNHLGSVQYNTLSGYVASRMNICFPTSEILYNTAIVNNPDPTGIH